MEREFYPIADSGFVRQLLHFNYDPELEQMEKTCPREIPPGHRFYGRWVDRRRFEIGIEPIPSGDVMGAIADVRNAEGDDLDSKSDAELKTIAAMAGVKYAAKGQERGDLIARIREKRNTK